MLILQENTKSHSREKPLRGKCELSFIYVLFVLIHKATVLFVSERLNNSVSIFSEMMEELSCMNKTKVSPVPL